VFLSTAAPLTYPDGRTKPGPPRPEVNERCLPKYSPRGNEGLPISQDSFMLVRIAKLSSKYRLNACRKRRADTRRTRNNEHNKR